MTLDKLSADGWGFDLIPHPTCHADARVSVHVEQRGSSLHLTYRLSGDLSDIIIPPPAPPIRTDELWRTTCFELFIQGEGASYREFNFSPSSAWAAYHFDGYREGMRVAEQEKPEVRWSDGALEVGLPVQLFGNERIGLSAVVELTGGERLFYALAHPPGVPDFHHRACFAATLPPMSAK